MLPRLQLQPRAELPFGRDNARKILCQCRKLRALQFQLPIRRRPIRQLSFFPNFFPISFAERKRPPRFDPLPVDADVARAYGRVYAMVAASGRKARGRRTVDLLIAATALAANLPLYTRNPDDFAGLSDLLDVVPI